MRVSAMPGATWCDLAQRFGEFDVALANDTGIPVRAT